jgi:hypothetical protein
VALPFERSAWFAFDKAAQVPCAHLSARCRCTIHASLLERGQAGCSAYDCYGAGQRVCAELFGGRSWRRDRALLFAMSRALPRLRDVHELLLLLREAARLELPNAERVRLRQLQQLLEPPQGFTPSRLERLDLEALRRDAFSFLRGLRALPAAQRLRRRLPLFAASG